MTAFKKASDKHKISVLLAALVFSGLLNLVMATGTVVLALQMPDLLSRKEFILAPGVSTFGPVSPGRLSKDYIEQGFSHIAGKITGWTYRGIEENFDHLYTYFYNDQVEGRTRANLKAQKYFSYVKSNKINSFWHYNFKESDYRWCEQVKVARYHGSGAACGIVTGFQETFANNNSPLFYKRVSYLIFAVARAPNPSDPKAIFGFEVFRVKRGSLKDLKRELDIAYKKGVLPKEVEDDYVQS